MYNIDSTCQIPNDVLQNLYIKYFGFINNGRFVEVGAYDGITYSNTSGLSFAGWTGLYIEADKKSSLSCIENHKQNSQISVCQSAVGNTTGVCKLYKSAVNGDSVSSILLEKTNIDWGCREDNYEEVPIDTLDNILEKFSWTDSFELLVIDVEESELQVLQGFSIEKYNPKMVIIEINERDDDFSKSKKNFIINYFEKNKYSKIYSDHINTIYIRNEE